MQFKALCARRRSTGGGSLTKMFLVMKLTAFFLTVAVCSVQARGLSQTISLSVKDAPLETVFKAIESQTNYVFFTRADVLEKGAKVTLNLKNVTLREALDACFRDQPLTWSLEGRIIAVEPRISVVPVVLAPAPPPGEVHGRVVDSAGNPLAGASITLKGMKGVGAVTDAQGYFTLKNVEDGAKLIFSFTGYVSREVIWSGKAFGNIELKHNNDPLDEIQVIAYGTQTQRYSVGSVSTVTAAEIESQPVSNPLAALEGRVPGLIVNQSSGTPGSSFTLQIRGQNALGQVAGGSNAFVGGQLTQPLFIIDGVPFAPQNNNINQYSPLGTGAGPSPTLPIPGAGGGLSPFNSINPNDIESIEILRDADATSIYGARGANGVILITTKRGKSGATRFTTNIYSGENQAGPTIPMMNTQQYLQMRHEAFNNDGDTPNPNNDYDLLSYDTTRYTDFRKEFFGGTSHTNDVNTSLSGGSGNTQFLIGAGYHDETYITPGDFADKRGSLNLSLSHNSTDKRLSIVFSANYSYDQNNSSGQPNAVYAFTLPPDFPAFTDAKGNLIWSYNGVDLGANYGNPFAYLKQPYESQNYNLISHFQVDYKILPGLTVRSSFGYNVFNGNEISKVPLYSLDPADYPQSSANFGTNTYSSWIIEPQAEYRKIIGKGRLDFLVGSTFQQNANNSTSLTGYDYPNDVLLGSVAGASSTSGNSSSSLYKYNAVFGRLGYSYANRYIINLNARRDGSSRFGPGDQFGNFGSVAVGWIFSEEPFMKDLLSKLSYGKIHVSYGTSGSDGIGDYNYLSRWQPTNFAYQNQVGYYPLNLYNPNFSWALNKKLETGLNLGFFKDRLLAGLTWFRNQCGNQLVSYNLPDQVGFSRVVQNAPYTVQNTGLEIQLTSVNIKSKDFTWSTALNFSIPRSKLVSFPGLATSPYVNEFVLGKSLSILQGYKLLGVNDTTGVFQYLTAKGTPTYTPTSPTATNRGDLQIIGDLASKINGGFRNQFTYKGFQLDIFVMFNKQLGINYLGEIYTQRGAPGIQVNQPALLLANAWHKPGDKTSMEQFTQDPNSAAYQAVNYFYLSSGSYSDASYIRVKTVSLSYNFSDSYLKKMKIQSCRLFINTQNLFTITSYTGDPETQNLYGIPPLKTVVAGLSFTL